MGILNIEPTNMNLEERRGRCGVYGGCLNVDALLLVEPGESLSGANFLVNWFWAGYFVIILFICGYARKFLTPFFL